MGCQLGSIVVLLGRWPWLEVGMCVVFAGSVLTVEQEISRFTVLQKCHQQEIMIFTYAARILIVQ